MFLPCFLLRAAVFLTALVKCLSILLCPKATAGRVQRPSCLCVLKGHCSELLWSLSAFISCAVKSFSPVMALVHQTCSPCKYPQAGNPFADGLHDLLQKALDLQLCAQARESLFILLCSNIFSPPLSFLFIYLFFFPAAEDFFTPGGRNHLPMLLSSPGYSLFIYYLLTRGNLYFKDQALTENASSGLQLE